MGYIYGLIAAIIWGAQPVVATLGYRAGMSALDLTLLRYLMSGVLMLPYFLRHDPRNAAGIGWPKALTLLLLAGPLYNLILIGALNWAPASHSSVIHPAGIPLFTALLSTLLLSRQERIPPAALILLMSGVLIIKFGAIFSETVSGTEVWKGDLLFILAAALWALYIVLVRRWNIPSLPCVVMVQVGGLPWVPVYFIFEGTHLFSLNPWSIAIQAIYLGVIVSIVSVLMFNSAIRQLGSRASMFSALMPIVGVSLAVLLLGETPGLELLLGTACVVGGMFLALRK